MPIASPAAFVAPFRITDGRHFRLADHAPDSLGGHDLSKEEGKALLEEGKVRLKAMQERLYAADSWSVLLILQAMDAAGKDSTIEHVMSGVNPQGCQVHSFKAPSAEELDHDFLWRSVKALPERGRIGIHNRSYYEEVLVVRVHPDFLAGQRLPGNGVGRKPGSAKFWTERLESIADHERHLARSGTAVLKFFLHVSKEEQKKRQLERIDDPKKNWKFNARDVEERAHWDAYMAAYEDAIRATAAPHAPWYVIPADRKWFMRLAVMQAILAEMEALALEFPKLSADAVARLGEARTTLLAS
ncbi:MAG: polyphosphate kinase 2 family protein [Hyphomicrobiales bacterium]|nr:polyphosphate kinase 2 family protein [Hyphomicrobiales bacterium]